MTVKPMTNHTAYDEGYDAYWDGVNVSDNPYDEEKDADARLSWEQGWRKAREHDYDESEG
jgi:ribosome modulation factor